MKKHTIIAILLATFFVASSAQADVVINFDALTAETPVGTAFQDKGIIFDGFLVSNLDWSAIIIPSTPNYVRLSTQTATIRFVDPLSPSTRATTSYFEFENAGLLYSGGYLGGATIKAWSLTGDLLATVTTNPVGSYAARDKFFTVFDIPGIHSIEFTMISNPLGGAVTLPLDNIRFADVTPVPLPGAIFLLGSGLIGLVGTRKKKKILG